MEIGGADVTNLTTKDVAPDPIKYPAHYNRHPSGVECITINEHMSFCLGNAFKYIWRAGLKGGEGGAIKDLCKARRYLEREINRLSGTPGWDEDLGDG